MLNNKQKNIFIQKDEIKEVCPCCIKRNKRARKRIIKKNVFKNKKATK